MLSVNDKVYGDINHVSIVYDTFDGMEKISIMHGNITEYTLYISYDKLLSYTSELITTSFKSNQDILSLSRHEIISHSQLSNANSFEVIQSYLLTNQIITQDVLNDWMDKNESYDYGMRKAAYGTALTALTTLHYNDMITAYYAYYFNITYSRQEDTTILTGVNINQQTYTTTNDPTTGYTIYSGTDANRFYFRLMTTLMFSECERMAIQSSLQNATSGLLTFYKELLHYQDLTFTYDNITHIMNVTTVNPDYYIEVDMTTEIAKVFLNAETSYETLDINETFKGAHGTIGEGGCYHNQKTENLLNTTRKIYEITSNPNNNVTDDLENLINSEVQSFLEDSLGSAMISGGLMITLSSGGIGLIVGGPMIMAGAVLWFHAAGANSIDDLQNPKIYTSACTSILLASIGGTELKTAANAAKLTVKTTIKDKTKTVITASIEQNGLNSKIDIAKNYVDGKIREYGIGYAFDMLGYDENAH